MKTKITLDTIDCHSALLGTQSAHDMHTCITYTTMHFYILSISVSPTAD